MWKALLFSSSSTNYFVAAGLASVLVVVVVDFVALTVAGLALTVFVVVDLVAFVAVVVFVLASCANATELTKANAAMAVKIFFIVCINFAAKLCKNFISANNNGHHFI